MKMLLQLIVIFTFFVKKIVSHYDDFPKFCQNLGYPVEQHTVITEDGYILKVFRIQSKPTTQFSNTLKVVYLQHGLLDSSDTWIVNSKTIDHAPAFFFADNGYDVWLGNTRGNYYSKAHVRLNPKKDKEFWNFSFKEMGKYDIPAVFTYISKINENKINYVGHSQGTTQFFYALTQNIPEIEDRLENYFALAPVAYLGNMSSPLMTKLAKQNHLIIRILKEFGINELLKRNWEVSNTAGILCNLDEKFCISILTMISDQDERYLDEAEIPTFIQHFPSGASVKSFEHYLQCYENNDFKDFDYGSAEANMKIYGTPTPPAFNLSNINRTIYAYAGDNDELADVKDVARLKAQLGDRLQLITFNDFGHASFVWGTTMPHLAYINAIIQKETLKSDKPTDDEKKFLSLK